jgi:hypothetical protein
METKRIEPAAYGLQSLRKAIRLAEGTVIKPRKSMARENLIMGRAVQFAATAEYVFKAREPGA